MPNRLLNIYFIYLKSPEKFNHMCNRIYRQRRTILSNIFHKENIYPGKITYMQGQYKISLNCQGVRSSVGGLNLSVFQSKHFELSLS